MSLLTGGRLGKTIFEGPFQPSSICESVNFGFAETLSFYYNFWGNNLDLGGDRQGHQKKNHEMLFIA